MGLRERIDDVLQRGEFDADLFEHAVTDLLAPAHPGLSPVPGGTDHGRDADIHGDIAVPVRLLVTRRKDVIENVRTGLRRLKEEGHPVERIIVASSQVLNADRRKKIETLAAKHGASVAGIYDQTGLAPLFYQNPEWRRRLLGLGGELDGLVRRPIELDLTPGGSAPLVGRGESLERLAGATGDLILIAVPGAGKTRLLGELDGVWFVEDASDEAIADTARRERPERIVVDDAAFDTRRIELLLRLRAAEPELGFSIIAVGWPDDEPALMQAMATATVQRLDLLEPEHINSIVESLGITAWGLRSEILDQAAGRPGWAVALSTLALSGGLRTIVSGHGLIREVGPYLRRVGPAGPETAAALAHVAVLGRASESDLDRIADRLRVSRPSVVDIVGRAASAGLLERLHDGWAVRPDALRRGLVASWFFDQPAAPGLDTLVAKWPDRIADLVSGAFDAAETGSDKARAWVRSTIYARADLRPWILKRYAQLGDEEATQAFGLAREPETPRAVLADVEDVAAVSFLLPQAIDALLERAVGDARQLHSTPSHPIRSLAEAATAFHPDWGTHFSARERILSTAATWADRHPESGRWMVFARLAAELLAPAADGHWLDPVDRRTVHFWSPVESADRMRLIGQQLWPVVCVRLEAMPDEAVAPLVDMVFDWLRAGTGFNPRFDHRLGADQAAAAMDVALQIVRDLAARSKPTSGLAVRLRELDERRELGLEIAVDAELDAITTYPWREREDGGEAAWRDRLIAIGRSWIVETPDALFARLRRIRDQAVLANRANPMAIAVALGGLLDAGADAESAARAAVSVGLCWESQPLFRRLATEKPLVLAEWLRKPTPACRDALVAVAFEPGIPTEVVEAGLAQLTANDEGIVESSLLRGIETGHFFRLLLGSAIGEIRAAAALSVDPDGKYGPTLPEDLRDAWRGAFLEARPDRRGMLEHRLGEWLKRLVTEDPSLLVEWLEARLSEAGPYEYHRVVPYHSEPELERLPRPERERLLRGRTKDGERQHFLGLLMGEDAEWVESLMQEGVIDADDVLHGLAGVHGDEFTERQPQFEAIAPVLLDAGVAPEAIASTSEFGVGRGEDSERYDHLREYFTGLALSDNPRLARIGDAGRTRYERLQAAAASAERRAHIERRD